MKRFWGYLGILPLLFLFAAEFTVQAQVTEKKSGFTGDPSRKRGSELGYDYGLKAGRSDYQDGQEANPRSHSEYVNPNPMYRYEYGYRASFNAGFRSGFLNGYKESYGEEPLSIDVTEVPEKTLLDREKIPLETVKNITPPSETETGAPVLLPRDTSTVTSSPTITKKTKVNKTREKKEEAPTVVDAYSDAL
jgi:hypothetical protein